MVKTARLLPVGSVLLLMGRSTLGLCIAFVLWALAYASSLAHRTRKASSGGTWGDFLLTLCAMTLSLGQGVRFVADSRFAMVMVLMASVWTAGAFQRWPHMHPSLCVLLGVSAAVALVVFAWVGSSWQWAEISFSAPEPLFWLVDILVGDYVATTLAPDSGVVMMLSVLGTAFLAKQVHGQVHHHSMSTWPFLFFVFPCLCAWQRQRFLVFSKMLVALKPEKMLYCVACVGVLALCSAVYTPMTHVLLCVHFAVLHWRQIIWMKRIYYNSSAPPI